MFLEVKARVVNEKWTINLNNVAFILPYEGGTHFYFVGDRVPLDAEEDYETIKHKINEAESLDNQRAVEDIEYCERHEPTYNPDDGSM